MYAYRYQDDDGASDGESWTGDYGAAAADAAQGNSNEYWRLSPTWQGGFRGLLSLDCFQILQRKSQEFDEFQIHAESLEEDVSLCSPLSVAVRKERHGTADGQRLHRR